MKASAISSQIFTGIFMAPKVTETSDIHYSHGLEQDIGSRTITTTREYYPFQKETAKQVDEFVKPYKKYESNQDGLVEYIKKEIVNIKKELPITRNKYMRYINNELLTEQDNKVRDLLVKNKLQCFIRENFVKAMKDCIIK